jgi:hypothetical protein
LIENNLLDSHAYGLLQGTSSIQPPLAPLLSACCISVLHTFGEPAQSCDNIGSESALRQTRSLDAMPAAGVVPSYTLSRTAGRNVIDRVSVHCACTTSLSQEASLQRSKVMPSETYNLYVQQMQQVSRLCIQCEQSIRVMLVLVKLQLQQCRLMLKQSKHHLALFRLAWNQSQNRTERSASGAKACQLRGSFSRKSEFSNSPGNDMR